MTVNIALHAASAIQAAFYGKDTKIESDDFFDDLRDESRDNIGEEVENACTYYADREEIIRRYESDYGSEAEEMSDAGGAKFKASEFQQAMVQYAKAVAHCAISAAVESEIDDLKEAYENLIETMPDDMEIPVTLETECIHGWAAHDRETAEGVCIWHRLEGELEARAIHCGGFWLTATWTPERA